MKDIIENSVKNYMRKSYHNRRIVTESGANVPTLIRSIDNGQTPIKFPTATEGQSGERIFDLPEIPYRAEQAAKPILLFRGNYPADSNGQPITDVAVLAASENCLQEGTDYILSGSKERPTAVKLINPGTEWTYTDTAGKTLYRDINYYYHGLGTVLTAFDFENLQNESVKTKKAEINDLSVGDFLADEANIAELIRVIAGKCEVRDTTEIGIIKMWGGKDLPKNIDGGSNYLWCDGKTIAKKNYPALFEAWGITANTMSLPNFAGRVPVGYGEYEEKGNKYNTNVFDYGGERMHQITINEMPKHGHNVKFGRKDLYVDNSGKSFVTTGTSGFDRGADPAGGDQPMSLMQPYIGVKFIVRYK